MKRKQNLLTAVLIFLVVVLLFSPVIATAGKGCKNLAGESGQFYKTIISNGIEREYLLYVPPKYKSNRPTPLVFNFHGLSRDPDFHFWYTNMSELADKYKFILAFPLGWGAEVGGPPSWNGGFCCNPAVANNIDDVTFVSDMIDQISSEYCVNHKRIFATGHSNGGFMAARLGCELSERIAAIASNSGFDVAMNCDPSRPVPVIVFHGTADVVAPYEGGPGIFPILPPAPNVQEEVLEWASMNGCSDETVVTYQKGDVTCITYEDCEDDASVTLCTIEGGGHNWPGDIDLCELFPAGCLASGYTTQDINASRAIWKFFAAYSMPNDDDDDDDDN
jgi:polyhydroxybutyrate depolymerase